MRSFETKIWVIQSDDQKSSWVICFKYEMIVTIWNLEKLQFYNFLINIYSIKTFCLPYNFGHPTMVEQRYCPILNLTKHSLIICEFLFISWKKNCHICLTGYATYFIFLNPSINSLWKPVSNVVIFFLFQDSRNLYCV